MKKKVKKSLSALIALIIISIVVLSGCGNTISQDTATADEVGNYNYVFRTIGKQKYITPAETFAGGDGTEANPYQISNAAELAYLAKVCNEENSSDTKEYRSAYYVLTEDITINEHLDDENWKENAPEFAWTPIGLKNDFKGVFDGKNHTISGMYLNEDCNAENTTTNYGYGYAYGLFGNNQGTIKNLNVEKSYVCVSGYSTNIGAIVGENVLNEAVVENCSVSADIYCYDADCGGIVGLNMDGTAIKNCTFSGTVNTLRETATHSIGGITGYNSGNISSCQNKGSVISGDNGSDNAGGIAGSHNGGKISNSTNDGAISGSQRAGGIAGYVFLSNIGGKYVSTESSIENCVNNGSIKTGSDYAGGIAGEVKNDYSEYSLNITNCKNNDKVQSSKKLGGIVGLLTLQGDIKISDCKNTVDMSGQAAGGIIGSASEMFGSLTVNDCDNSGEITGSLYAAGIIAENNLIGWDEEKHKPLNVTISSSKNTGKINTLRGGGIAGVFVNSIPAESSDRVSVTLDGNTNNADIHCTTDSSFVGGIAGNVGVANAAISVKNCVSSGTVNFDDSGVDDETTGIEENRIEFSRTGGGIVGMIEDGIFLTTTNDGVTGVNVNAPDAKIVFTNCHSNMQFNAPSEDKYTYDNDDEPVFLNRFGGVIGFCTDTEGYAFLVENCTYTNCDRGLGVKELPDVGTKK